MNNNPFSLINKTILVTGSSSGIGASVAIECSKLGAKLIITGRDLDNLNKTYKELHGLGHIQVIADLNKDEDIKALVSEIPEIDGIVHSAGILGTIPFGFITKGKIDEIFAINFASPILLSKNLLKYNKLKKNSSIVWISSIAGNLITSSGSSLYGASKSAINGIAKGMALELASKKIRVNVVSPGVIKTNIFNSGIISDNDLNMEVVKYPLKRFGNPEEVAFGVIYFLSNASSWTTGSCLTIDGGYTLL